MPGIVDLIRAILGLSMKSSQTGSLEAKAFTSATGDSKKIALAKLEAALPAPIGSDAYVVQPSVDYTETQGGLVTAIATYTLKPSPTDKPVRSPESAVSMPATSWTPSVLDGRTPEPRGYNSK